MVKPFIQPIKSLEHSPFPRTFIARVSRFLRQKYLEPRLLIVTDPRTDSQAIKEAGVWLGWGAIGEERAMPPTLQFLPDGPKRGLHYWQATRIKTIAVLQM